MKESKHGGKRQYTQNTKSQDNFFLGGVEIAANSWHFLHFFFLLTKLQRQNRHTFIIANGICAFWFCSTRSSPEFLHPSICVLCARIFLQKKKQNKTNTSLYSKKNKKFICVPLSIVCSFPLVIQHHPSFGICFLQSQSNRDIVLQLNSVVLRLLIPLAAFPIILFVLKSLSI